MNWTGRDDNWDPAPAWASCFLLGVWIVALPFVAIMAAGFFLYGYYLHKTERLR